MSSTPQPLTTTQTSPTGVLTFDDIPGHVEHAPAPTRPAYDPNAHPGGRGVTPKNVTAEGPSIHAAPSGVQKLESDVENPADVLVPLDTAANVWNDLRQTLHEHQSEHPVLGEVANKMDALQELLFGGQSAGKPMGTREGVADEANALSMAEAAPELAESAVELGSRGLEHLSDTGRTFAEGLKEEGQRMLNAKAPLDFSSIQGHELVQEGRDFTGNFEKDNFSSRRTTGNNMFDPESMVTGEELEKGLTPTNSRRVYPTHQDYLAAVHGDIPANEVPTRFPRQLIETPKRSSEAGFLEVPGTTEAPVQEMEKSANGDIPESQRTATPEEEKSTLDKMKEVYPTTTDPGAAQRGASFITPEGEFMPLGAGTEHPQAIEKVTGKAADEGPGFDNRPEFLNDTGLVRVRMTQDRAGTTAHVSVPSNGVNPQQISAIQQLVGKNRYGNLMLEVAEKGGASEYKEFASPADVEPMIKNIGAHPNDWSRVAAQNMEKNGGFTVNPRTGQVPTEGYAVEVGPEYRKEFPDHNVTNKDIQNFYQEHKALFDRHPELYIGGWKGELNVTGIAKDQAGAESLARKLDQKAIFDLKNGQEIPTGGSSAKKQFPNYPMKNRLDDLTGRTESIARIRAGRQAEESAKKKSLTNAKAPAKMLATSKGNK